MNEWINQSMKKKRKKELNSILEEEKVEIGFDKKKSGKKSKRNYLY